MEGNVNYQVLSASLVGTGVLMMGVGALALS
jgi:hypothetical protein